MKSISVLKYLERKRCPFLQGNKPLTKNSAFLSVFNLDVFCPCFFGPEIAGASPGHDSCAMVGEARDARAGPRGSGCIHGAAEITREEPDCCADKRDGFWIQILQVMCWSRMAVRGKFSIFGPTDLLADLSHPVERGEIWILGGTRRLSSGAAYLSQPAVVVLVVVVVVVVIVIIVVAVLMDRPPHMHQMLRVPPLWW